MKTTLTTLLGAAIVLLANPVVSHAGGKGKGGPGDGGGTDDGGGSTLQGTIYYYGNIAGWNGTPTLSMNPDGSNQAVIGSGGSSRIFGEPSLNLHNGHRWLFSKEIFTDQQYPDGSYRGQYLALRDDYDPQAYDEQTRAHLIDDVNDDPTLQLWGAHWLLDDGWVSFIGRRWSSDQPDATVVEGGIYTAPVVFDADGNIAGLGEMSAAPAIPMALDATAGYPWPDVDYYSWNPEGTEIVYDKRSGLGIWVADLFGGDSMLHYVAGEMPQWSPDGASIAYGARGEIVIIRSDGKGKSVYVSPGSDWMFRFAHWAPDSQSLVFTGLPKTGSGVYSWDGDLFLVGADGNGLVNVTNTPGGREVTGAFNAGWR